MGSILRKYKVKIKNYKLSIIIFTFIVLLTGCNNEENSIDNASKDPAIQEDDESSRFLPSRSDFENLDKDSSINEIIEQFGNCGYEGSGIIYHVWMLDDGSKAKLVFNSKGKIEFIFIVTDDSSERIYDRDNY